jgi:hypothetical protein
MSLEALDPLARSGSVLAWHDLAVLYHARAAMDALSMPNAWKVALSFWSHVWKSDAYWTYVQERADNLADQRISSTTVDELRRALPGRILRMTTEKVASLIERGDDSAAIEHLNVVKQAGFPEDEVDRVRRGATERLRLRVQGAISEFRQELNRESESGPTQHSLSAKLGYQSNKLRGEVAAPVTRLKALDPSSEDVAKLADEAASHLRALSVRYHNEANDTDMAIVLIGAAEGLAVSAQLRQQFASDRNYLLSRSTFNKAAARNLSIDLRHRAG